MLRMHKDPKYKGCLYSVKVSDYTESAHSILTSALQEAFGVHGKRVPDDLASDVAEYLMDEMKIGATGKSSKTLIVRELEAMKRDAQRKAEASPVARGRLRGLAQALALVRDPGGFPALNPAGQLERIREEEASG